MYVFFIDGVCVCGLCGEVEEQCVAAATYPTRLRSSSTTVQTQQRREVRQVKSGVGLGHIEDLEDKERG